jgi:threonylcarbamoyladenosine tRNA methylthiotransferase MtaB
VELVEKLPVTYLHVFPYSPRSDTAAIGLPDQVPPATAAARAGILRDQDAHNRRAFMEQNLGQIRPVLLEHQKDDGRWSGRTDNYLPVIVAGPEISRGRIVPVRLTAITNNVLEGESA